jgi:hypothetical protein
MQALPAVTSLDAVRKKTGRPAYVPTDEGREIVEMLRANGVDIGVIAKVLRISPSTLHRYYGAELRDGHEMVKAKIGAALVKAALAGNVSAIRTWLIMKGGPEWRMPKWSDDLGAPDDPGEAVHFYLPPNGRDKPEPILAPAPPAPSVNSTPALASPPSDTFAWSKL